jgi:hypothetical protein
MFCTVSDNDANNNDNGTAGHVRSLIEAAAKAGNLFFCCGGSDMAIKDIGWISEVRRDTLDDEESDGDGPSIKQGFL